MVRIAITAEVFEAICATLALGSVGYEHQHSAFIPLEEAVADPAYEQVGRRSERQVLHLPTEAR
jgi:hypothetical protein